METPPTNAPCPPEPPPVADAPPQARGIFLRLSGHARIVVSGGVLLFKLAIFAAISIVWLAVAEELQYQRAYRLDDLFLVGVCMFGTAFVARLLANHARPVIVSAVALCTSALWVAAVVYSSRLNNSLDLPLTRGAVQAGTAMLLGGIAGHLLYTVLQFLVRKLDCSPAVAGLLPTFGHACGGGEYRAELEDALARALGAYAMFLRNVRMLLLGAIVPFLVLLSYAWTQSMFRRAASPRPWNFWSETDVAIWAAISFVAAAIASIVLLPAGRLKSCLAISVGTLVCMSSGVLLAVQFPPIAAAVEPLSIVEVIFASAAMTVLSCVATQFIFSFVIRRALPAVLGRHLLPASSEAGQPSTEHQTPLCCEQCGYALDGLPVTRCEKCGVDELRCPECGHQQPAGVRHARAIIRVHKFHVALRVVSWLVALGMATALLAPWWSIGAFSGGNLLGSSAKAQELLAIGMACAFAAAPLRLLVLHWRPTILISLLVGFASFCAFLLGASIGLGAEAKLWDVFRVFLPGWMVGSFLTPYVWRGFLALMYGDWGRAVYVWQAIRAYRHSTAELVAADSDRVAGAELPLRCADCGAELAGEVRATCPACGVHGAACPACTTRRPISAVRIAFENMIFRARAMLLMLISVHCAAALVVCGFMVMVMGMDSGHSYGYESYRALIPAIMASLVYGALVGATLLRRGFLFATAVVELSHVVLFLVLPFAFEFARPRWLELLGGPYGQICLCATISAIAGAVLVPPILTLLAAGLLPAANGQALMDFLRSRATLDQAAARLPTRSSR